MYVRSELAPAMIVAQEVAYDREDNAESLKRDVPTGTNDLGNVRDRIARM